MHRLNVKVQKSMETRTKEAWLHLDERDKEGNYTVIKESIHQKDRIIITYICYICTKEQKT